ncbi:MAG TPA: GYD domain-containing protein [Nitrososphaeraceae archaeon]|nr:GYD domain-containing protein [Nitrososphaeraceae archaeon]
MPNYIILYNWTEQGIRNVKDVPKRIENFKSELEKVGAKLINEYFTFGEYDGIIIVEAPDDKAIMKVMLSTGSLGNVRTRTIKAFTYNEESRDIFDNL